MRIVVPLILGLAGCPGATEVTEPPTDTTPPVTTDTGTPPAILGASWRLHDTFGSVVYVSWDQPVAEDAHIEFSVDDGVWVSTPTQPAPEGRNERLVLGIPFDTSAQWRIVTPSGTTAIASDPILTAPPPANLPLGTLRTADETAWYADGRYFLTSASNRTGSWAGGQFWTMIVDRQGRTVWAHPAPSRHWTLFAQVALTGDHLLWDEATFWSNFDDGEGSQVHRQYLDQTDSFEQIATPGLHHAFVQLPDGTLAWGSQFHDPTEALVELAPGALEPTVIWTCRGDWPGSGDCESNGLFYSPTRNTYLYSFYTNNSIVEVDRAKGGSRWWAGSVAGGFSFDPVDSQVSWQHGISWTDAGTLLVSSDDYVGGRPVTMLREYTVDEYAGVLTEIWNYNPGITADTNGDAWRLPNGNTLHVIGSGGQVREVDPKGNLVWRVDFVEEGRFRLMGRGEFIGDLYALASPQAR